MKRISRVSSFSLVEVIIAIGVAAMCLITVFGLLPIGLATNQNAIQRAASADIVGAVIADLRATPVTIPRGEAAISQQFAIAMPPNPVSVKTTTTLFFGSDGQFSTLPNSGSRYRLVVSFLPNGSGSRSATLADLTMTWPAVANPAKSTGTLEIFAGFDRN